MELKNIISFVGRGESSHVEHPIFNVAKKCKTISEFLETLSTDGYVWLATQINRNLVHETHPEAWALYQSRMRQANQECRLISFEAIEDYQNVVLDTCKTIVVNWTDS